MDSQLLKENALRHAVTETERMQDVNFAVVMSKTFNEFILRETHQITFLFKILKQRVSLFFDIGKMAETGVALIDIHFTQLPRPVEDILIELAMNSAEMRQSPHQRPEFNGCRA